MKKLSLAITLALASASYSASAGFGDLLGGSKDSGSSSLDIKSMANTVQSIAQVMKEPKIVELRIAAQQCVVKHEDTNLFAQSILNKLLKAHGEALEAPSLVLTTALEYTASSSIDEIALSNGVLFDATSEDEIAFMLAHELAHIIKGHRGSKEYFAQQERVVNILSRMSIAVGLIRASMLEKDGSDVKHAADITNQLEDTVKLNAVINEVSEYILSSSFTREQEEQADLLAIDLLAKTEYSLGGYVPAFERIKQNDQYVEKKLKKVQAHMMAIMNMLDGGGSGSDSPEKMLMKQLVQEVSAELLTNLAKEHPDPEARLATVVQYTKKNHNKRRKSKAIDEQHYAEIKQSPMFTQSVALYASVSKFNRLIDDAKDSKRPAFNRSSVEKLESEAAPLLKQGDAYTNYVLSRAYQSLGEPKKQNQYLNAIQDLEGASQNVFEAVMALQLRDKEFDSLKSTVDLGMKVIGEAAKFYPFLVSVLANSDDEAALKKAMSECGEHGIAIDKECQTVAARKLKTSETKDVATKDDPKKKVLSLF